MAIDSGMPHRILLIDSYDSFTYKSVSAFPRSTRETDLSPSSLACLCRRSITNCRIHIIKNDQFSLSEILPYLGYFAAVIVGPGPGSPERPEEVGIIKDLWKIANEHLLPIFGVCLGLQSLGVEFRAKLKRLDVVKHGQVSHIYHEGIDIFKGVGEVNGVRYHSLHVELAADGELQQLAWSDDGEENGLVVMALKHTSKPFWAVQYHPESVCTDGGGSEVISNFWRLARNWAGTHERRPRPWSATAQDIIGPSWPQVLSNIPSKVPSVIGTVTTHVFSSPDLATTTICELFGVSDESTSFVLLDSVAQPGRFTIIGVLNHSTPKITYFTGESFVTMTKGSIPIRQSLRSHDIWSWLAAFMRGRKFQGGSSEIPFWGGLVGYLSYELGVRSLSVPRRTEEVKSHPDINLVFVERSIVRDSVTGNVYVQSLIPNDDAWISDTAARIKDAVRPLDLDVDQVTSRQKCYEALTSNAPIVMLPDKASYISRIKSAKDHLFAGDSYELCVTAPTRIIRDKLSTKSNDKPTSSSWELYKTLRSKNPAPYSGYIRLHPSTLVASSPERFLSYSRGPGTVCQLRPIKGTLRKGPGVTRAVAEQALAGNRKEVAENLMIVDLIRHDLHGVVGEDVEVRKFCGVEESETVWSLVSVIEGKLPLSALNIPNLDSELGWEVLSRSLPPGKYIHFYLRRLVVVDISWIGSMTGAPKKRSVEILQNLEDSSRNIYSGVFGYWCVGGGGDWSVVIRSCFKYDDQTDTPSNDVLRPSTIANDKEEWVIGAGGAITALSDPEAEWDEMIVKLQSALGAFGATVSPQTQ
jgi:para-aminobenzoate synthetase